MAAPAKNSDNYSSNQPSSFSVGSSPPAILTLPCSSSTSSLNLFEHTHTHTHTHAQISINNSLNYLLKNQVKAMEKDQRVKKSAAAKHDTEEASSIEWEFINMTEQEEDLIYRMYRLVGANWRLIAGRIPGRKAEEIERFWLMRHDQAFAEKRNHRN